MNIQVKISFRGVPQKYYVYTRLSKVRFEEKGLPDILGCAET